MLTVEPALRALTVEAYTLDKLRALTRAEEREEAAVAPQRIVEATEADEVIVMLLTGHGVLEQHDLTLQLAVAAPHDVDSLAGKVDIGQMGNAAEGRKVAFGVDMNKETGTRRKARYQSSQLRRVVMGGDEKSQLHKPVCLSLDNKTNAKVIKKTD